jgi:hypothetical protein
MILPGHCIPERFKGRPGQDRRLSSSRLCGKFLFFSAEVVTLGSKILPTRVSHLVDYLSSSRCTLFPLQRSSSKISRVVSRLLFTGGYSQFVHISSHLIPFDILQHLAFLPLLHFFSLDAYPMAEDAETSSLFIGLAF